MSTQNKLVIGLFGFGVVGEGIYKVLQQTPSLNTVIKKICIKHPDKKRDAPSELFTTSYDEILSDPQINLVVELIDDAQEAFSIVSTALKSGKSVVSANKKLVAEHLSELIALQEVNNVSFLYEAAVCGSIPVIRNLEEYYDNDLLQSICGIVNGSTNYILTKINEDKLSYEDALLQAQQLGFAESNPKLDVEGIDAANKLTILLAHAYGIISNPGELLVKGINHLHSADAAFAEEKGYAIKLTAQAKKLQDGQVAAFVLPQFVTSESQLFTTKNEFNGVVIESKLADKQFLYGKGAGRYPTASAVLSDIAALRYHYRYEYRKLNKESAAVTRDYYLKVFVSFDDWQQVNKWEFEWIEEFHSTEKRQYLIGVISAEKLKSAEWYYDPSVSVILVPNALIQKHALVNKSLKKLSLQLAGVS